MRYREDCEGSGRRRGSASVAVSVGVLLAGLVGCSSSDTAGSSSELAAATTVEDVTTTSSSTTTSTTAPTTTTDAGPVIEVVGGGSSEPSVDSTVALEPIPVPTNTMFDPATPSGEVEQALLSNHGAFAECLDQLPNCDPQATMRFALLEFAADNVKLIEGWNADGLEIRNGDEWVYVVEDVEFSDDGLEAIVSDCSYDGAQLVVPATADSAEQVVDAGDISEKAKYLAMRVGDQWLITIGERIERLEGRVEGYCR